MRFVLLSDTHNLHDRMIPPPAGDVIVHAGDVSGSGTLEEIAAFFRWFGALPHRHKVVIAGNHASICDVRYAHVNPAVTVDL